MIKICKFCKNEIEVKTFQEMGGHVAGCTENPNKRETVDKIRKYHQEKNPTVKITLKCKACLSEYCLDLSTTDIKKGRYRRYCSRSCSNRKLQKDETRSKISDSVKKYYSDKIRPNKKCINCNGDLGKNNKSGYCKRNEECRMLLYSEISKKIKGISKNSGEMNPMFGL